MIQALLSHKSPPIQIYELWKIDKAKIIFFFLYYLKDDIILLVIKNFKTNLNMIPLISNTWNFFANRVNTVIACGGDPTCVASNEITEFFKFILYKGAQFPGKLLVSLIPEEYSPFSDSPDSWNNRLERQMTSWIKPEAIKKEWEMLERGLKKGETLPLRDFSAFNLIGPTLLAGGFASICLEHVIATASYLRKIIKQDFTETKLTFIEIETAVTSENGEDLESGEAKVQTKKVLSPTTYIHNPRTIWKAAAKHTISALISGTISYLTASSMAEELANEGLGEKAPYVAAALVVAGLAAIRFRNQLLAAGTGLAFKAVSSTWTWCKNSTFAIGRFLTDGWYNNRYTFQTQL